MKKIIKIAHLYYDLMNLYGESGNIKALKRFIERQGVEVEIHFLTLNDKINFKKYDIYYMGAGSEENELIVLNDLFSYVDAIKKAIEDGKMFLITGNSMELFGQRMRGKYDTSGNVDCLRIFDYYAYEAPQRLISDIIYEFDKLPIDKGRNIVGFKNCRCEIDDNDDKRLFNNSDSFNYKNFYAMMFVGPVLVRNPYFTDYLLEKLFDEKGYDYNSCEDYIEYEAYKEFERNFISNTNLD